MCEIKNNKLLLPIEQAVYAYHNGLVKGLGIYLYLKFYSDGKIKSDSPVFAQLRKDLRLTDNRTFKKHIDKLLEHKWIGYSQLSDVYYLRKTKFIRLLHDFRLRQAAIVEPQDLKHIQVYLAAIIICKEIKDMEYYWDVVKPRRLEKAAVKWRSAKHWKVSSHSSNRPAYFGLCNKTIAKLLACKQTRACVLKQKAEALGYLESSHRYRDIKEFAKPDFHFRGQMYQQFPETKGRIRVWRKWRGDVKYYKFVLQLHDEIIPKISFKRIEKLSSIRLPVEVLRGLNNEIRKAA